MFKRLLLVIAILSAIVFIPYFLGMIDFLDFGNSMPTWAIGVINLFVLIEVIFILITIIQMGIYIYKFIRYGEK